MSSNITDLITNCGGTIVCFRKIVKESKVRVIHRLTNQKEKLKKRKGNENVVAANERKAERLVEEIQRLKHIEADKITKFSLANTQTVEEAAKQGSLETKMMTRIACEKPMQDKVMRWREKHEDWRSLAAFILTKNTGRRYRKNRKVQTKQGEKDALALATDSVRSMSKDGLGRDRTSNSDEDYSDGEDMADAKQVADMSDEDEMSDSRQVSDMSDQDQMSDMRLAANSSDEDEMSNYRQVANLSDEDEMSNFRQVANSSDEDDSPDQWDVSASDDSAADDGVNVESDGESINDVTSSVSKLKEKLLSKSSLKERSEPKSMGRAVAKAKPAAVESKLTSASQEHTGSPLKAISDIRTALLGGSAKDTRKQKSATSKEHQSLSKVEGELVVKKLRLDNESDEVRLPGVEIIPSPTKSDEDSDKGKPKDSFFLTAAGEEIEMAEGQAVEMESVKTNRYFAESLFMGSLSRDYKSSKMPAKKSNLKRPRENAGRGRGQYTGYSQTSKKGQMSKPQASSKHNTYKKDAVEKKEVLHPSWEASKRRKQQETEIKAFAGKKTTFDD